jgi:hypothetical protein
MTQVVIQPSYGNRDAWRHWEDTLDRPVNFSDTDRRQLLPAADLARLEALHPSGQARFWGATRVHDDKMVRLQQGDVVLFTGGKLVRGVGEVGHSFRSPEFADQLWSPHAERGSYRNVYSLLSFQPTSIPYQEIWDLPGFTHGDNFMGLRFLNEEKSATVLDGLHIETTTTALMGAAAAAQVAEQLAAGTVVPAEQVHTTHTSYETASKTTLVHRAEALLVGEYRTTLSQSSTVARLRTPAGVTDLYVQDQDEVEVVEAKRSSAHSFVREALGQLMDYAAHAPLPVTRLTVLLPTAPAPADLELLHRYGVDCVHRTGPESYVRQAASQPQRQRMQPIWSGTPASSPLRRQPPRPAS